MASQSTLFHLTPAVEAEPTPKPKRQPRASIAPVDAEPLEPLSPVEQVRQAFARHHRISAIMGFVLGGFIPAATFTVVHLEVSRYPALWVFVVGGLLYSALSVYLWAKQTFELTAKAIGFVVLIEGTVTFSRTLPLALAGLLILVSINGICATVALQTRR